MSSFDDLRDAMRRATEGRVLIGHGNRAAASWYHLIKVGALPTFDYFLTASAGGATDIAHKMFVLEDEQADHPDLVWEYAPYWQKLDELCGKYPNAIVFCTYRKPEHQDLLRRHPGILLSCPPQSIASGVENKANFHKILTDAGVTEILSTLLYSDALEIPPYNKVADQVGPDFVVQIIASAGGARHDLQSSINFVTDGSELAEAVSFQRGQGPVRVVTMAHGREANGAGLSTPWGTYVDLPSHKPVGLPELYGRPGAGSGNDWTWLYPQAQMAAYQRQIERVGAELSRRGFNGMFGLDSIFDETGDGPWPHEINGRSQGTTEAQDAVDLRAGVASLPMMAAALDLGIGPEYFPDVNEYNNASLRRVGQWYLKVSVPRPICVARDLNGVWTLRDGQLVGQHSGSILELKGDQLYIYGAPKKGKRGLPGTGLPTLYVNGLAPAVFTADDQLTEFGEQVRRAVYLGLGFKEGEF